MDTQLILQIIGYLIIIIAYTVFTVLKIKKSNNKTEVAETLNKYAEIVKQIPTMINNAENSVGAGNGALKKTLVLQQIQLLCAEKGIEYKNEEFSQEIEKMLTTPQKKEELCKNVNNNSSNQLTTTLQNVEMKTIENN